MNKLKLMNDNEDKKIITFTLNKEMRLNLTNELIRSKKYNLKMKSEWINEAIVMLKNNPDFKEAVSNAEGNNGDFVLDKVYMTFQQRCFFAEIRSEVVKSYPDIRGPQSAIIRAAILSRLIRGESS